MSGRFITLLDEEEFPFEHPSYSGVVIWYRRLTLDELEKIESKYRRVDWRRGERQVYVPETKQVQRTKDIVEHTIVRWEGVVDKSGNPVPCTLDHKLRLFGQYPVLWEALQTAARSDIGGEGGDDPNEDPTPG